jgi:hypothetical protein
MRQIPKLQYHACLAKILYMHACRLRTYIMILQFDESLNAEDEWAAGTGQRGGIASNATYILDEDFLTA